MGVKVKTLSPFGGGEASTAFSDNFNRANTTLGFISNQWLSHHGECVGGGVFQRAQINVNQLRWVRNAVAGNPGPGCYYIPRPVQQGLFGVRQFSQFTVISKTGVNGDDVGAVVMFTPDILAGNQNGYYVSYVTGADQIRLRRSDAASTVIAGPFAAALGDVIRCEVIPGGATNNVTIFRNGVSLFNTPADALGPNREGTPAIFGFIDAGDTVTIDGYSCGLL